MAPYPLPKAQKRPARPLAGPGRGIAWGEAVHLGRAAPVPCLFLMPDREAGDPRDGVGAAGPGDLGVSPPAGEPPAGGGRDALPRGRAADPAAGGHGRPPWGAIDTRAHDQGEGVGYMPRPWSRSLALGAARSAWRWATWAFIRSLAALFASTKALACRWASMAA